MEFWYRDFIGISLPYAPNVAGDRNALHNPYYFGFTSDMGVGNDFIRYPWYAAWFSQSVVNPQYPRNGLPRYLGIPAAAWRLRPTNGQWGNSRGREDWAYGGWYVGQFSNGRRHGVGTMRNATTDSWRTRTGEFQDGMSHGFGFEVQSNGNWWIGEWERRDNTSSMIRGIHIAANGRLSSWPRDGRAQGWSLHRWNDGTWYYGELNNNRIHGWGVHRFSDGTLHAGYWENGLRHGRGIEVRANGTVLIGYWVNGWINHGTETGIDGARSWTYTGYFRNGLRHGQGRIEWSDGSWYEGTWYRGQRHGFGASVAADGTLQIGHWSNGVFESS